MTLKTVTISITAATSSGTIPTDAVVTFELDGADVDAITGEIVVPDRTSVTLVNGVGSISKWPNARGTGATQYRVTIEGTSYRIAKSVTVPDANCDLYTLLQFAIVAPAAASAAQIAAEGYAAAASEDSAQTALDRIATTADAAQTAQDRAAAALSAAAAQAAATAQNADMVAAVSTATPTSSSTVLGETGGVVKRFAKDSLGPFVNVKDPAYGAVGDGVTDDTAAFVAAFAASDTVYAPAPGTSYVLTSLSLAAGKKLVTDGFSTVFQQKSGQAVGTRMFVVAGSNVEIGSCTVRGNIGTDTDEQNHAIFVQANATVGAIDNVRIGDVIGTNIRGDVVYLGQSGAATPLTNVNVGHVVCDNVYRNGVSIVSADGVTVESVEGDAVGYCHVDVEADIGSGPCVNIRVGHVKGRMLGLVSPAAADYIDAVTVGVADLSPDNAGQSTPSYAPGVAIEDGLLLRNVKRASIGHLKAGNFNRCAAFVTYNGGELGCEMLEIGSLHMRTCSLTDAVYASYIHGATGASRLKVGYTDVVITQASKRAFDGWDGSEWGAVVANIQNSSSLIKDCNDGIVGNVTQTGANGIFLLSCARFGVKGGSFAGDYFASFSDYCSFQNVTATAAVSLFTATYDHQFVANCTLNSVYYGFGAAARNYLNPVCFGAQQLWVDAHSMLRLKATAAGSDTDGDPLGKKVAVPATATTAGAPGQWAADTSNFYAYTGDGTTHTWRRVAVATW